MSSKETSNDSTSWADIYNTTNLKRSQTTAFHKDLVVHIPVDATYRYLSNTYFHQTHTTDSCSTYIHTTL